ncbi:MAG: signal recognition particle-docking protein FtsY [Xenococcaceae cyanobacterium MO_188.B19]|nr:signal recognition particle-docking protein FtsY [Xenococcaceae cyanobacterium MO_188.B19]
MFNWFRRQHNEQAPTEENKEKAPETTKVETEKPTDTKSAEDKLAQARAAFLNIQKRKKELAISTSEEEISTKSESTETSVEEETTEKEVEVTTAEAEKVVEETTTTTEAQASTPEAETPTATPEVPEETKTEEIPKNVPAWMQKSQGLEKLKETAIIEEEEPEIDEDFIWSVNVLAGEGRRPEDISEEEITWLTKLRQGLGKTRNSLIFQLKSIVGQGPLNKDAVMEIEALLLQADVGIEATDYIIETLQEKLKEEALPPEQAIAYLKEILQEILDKPLEGQDNQDFVPEKDQFNIWLLTGVNGAGKTTTIGKLANMANQSGYTCLIAAADTFRAAAVQQVQVWGERSNTEVIANPGQNIDPASVVYDAVSAANARNTELLLVDTAGRLQNKKNLMAELAKIRRVIDKKAPNAQIESLLVLDATLGQNGLRQAQVFSEAAQLSGVVLTKLDGSAKGGVALAVAKQLNLPIRFIGAGEGIEDLRPFSSYEFVEALLEG